MPVPRFFDYSARVCGELHTDTTQREIRAHSSQESKLMALDRYERRGKGMFAVRDFDAARQRLREQSTAIMPRRRDESH
jgi:hypothetical protein